MTDMTGFYQVLGTGEKVRIAVLPHVSGHELAAILLDVVSAILRGDGYDCAPMVRGGPATDEENRHPF